MSVETTFPSLVGETGSACRMRERGGCECLPGSPVQWPQESGDDEALDNGPAVSAAQPLRAKTVLLADDNCDMTYMVAVSLRIAGHVVHTANDGLQAAELAARLQPDVLILDIGMPGLNGYEVARRVRGQPWGASSLLIAATGWDHDDDRQKALAAGFDLHFTKPFDLQQLTALIAQRAV